jgi:hypothetical protein
LAHNTQDHGFLIFPGIRAHQNATILTANKEKDAKMQFGGIFEYRLVNTKVLELEEPAVVTKIDKNFFKVKTPGQLGLPGR